MQQKLLISCLLFLGNVRAQCTAIGKEVTVTGFIMDNFCIERGTLLDKPRFRTLENPGEHTIHCLVDIKQCTDSLFALLRPPADSGRLYSVWYQLGQEGTQLAIAEAKKARQSGAVAGFSITVKGVDDGSDILKCVEMVGRATTGGGSAGVDVIAYRSAHGALMLIAWLALIPTGIMIARYFKHWGATWYHAHALIQAVACLMTWISVIVIFASIWPSTSFASGGGVLLYSHATLGVIIAIVSLGQAILGKLADFLFDHGRSKIPWFPDQLHWLTGRVIMVFAVCNVLTGIVIHSTGLAGWLVIAVMLIFGWICSFVYMERQFAARRLNTINDMSME